MEKLAQVFISAVVFAHALLPQAQIPQVLGVRISDESITQEVIVDEETTRGQWIEEARRQRVESREEFRLKKEELRDENVTRREEFQKSLSEVKDARKREIVSNVDSKMMQINLRWTNHWSSVLEKLIDILAKIQSRADKLEEAGVDVSSVRESIESAQVSIDEAQTMVVNQATSEYIIVIDDQSELRSNIGRMVSEFRGNLKAVKDSITKAKTEVQNAAKALKDVSEQ